MRIATTLVTICGVALALAAAGDAAATDFAQTEYAVLGASSSRAWQSALTQDEFDVKDEPKPKKPGPKPASGDQAAPRGEFDAAAGSEADAGDGPSYTGRKVRAGAMSLILPGAGQYYNGDKQKAYILGGVEVAIWTAYFVFDKQGDNRMETSREWAGLYAGVSGDHSDRYWQNVGFYLDSDAYNEARLREARALQEPVSGLIEPADAWQWVNEDRWRGYAKLRADANSAYDRRDFMILFAVLNRTVAVVDAVIGAGAPDGKLEADVMGMNLKFGVQPEWTASGGVAPQASCVISRGF